MTSHTIIIGAGIVGASIAHRLSKAGAKVTLIDAAEAPGMGVSAASFGWITTAAGDPDLPDDVYGQRLRAIEDYAALDRDFGAVSAPHAAVRWCGAQARTKPATGQTDTRGRAVSCG